MHPGKALARLNAKHVRYNIGSGGWSELSDQDIAAAISFVPPGLGRELLCAVWWPAGAQLTIHMLHAQIRDMLLREWSAREDAMQTAMTRVAIHRGTADLHRATAAFRDAHANRWPRLIISADPITYNRPYDRIPVAVLKEVCLGALCETCDGRGTVRPGGKVSDCVACNGTGHRRPSERTRAESCGLADHSNYVRKWRPVYEWLLDQCSDPLSKAEREFCAQLR